MGQKKIYVSCQEKLNSRPSDSEVCRTSIRDELIHGLTHHKVLKGSLLVVKQMQIIFAFGFARRRPKVVFDLNMQSVSE